MNWRMWLRPSPATVIAIAALIVAAGGAAFAAIPDSSGTVHTCYQRSTGNLRAVESSSDCRPSENSLDLSQGGTGVSGGRIVARARASSPVPVSMSNPAIPLTGASWTQGPTETNEFFVEATVTTPSGNCAIFDVDVYAGGELVASLRFGGGGNFGDFVKGASGFLLDPGSATERTLTAEFSFPVHSLNCTDATLDSLRINVAALV
jgi:hypothetical protein